MAKIDDILIPSLTIRESADDGSDFSNPAADHRVLFLGEDGLLHLKDSAGTVTDVGAAGGGGAPAFAGVSVYKSGNQSIPTATSTAITFDTELFDTDGFHSTGSNTERLIVPAGKAGKYLVIGTVRHAAGGGSGGRFAQLFLNGLAGTLLTQTNVPNTADEVTLEVAVVADLAVGDYIALASYQGSGGALNAEGGGRHRTSLSMHLIGA